MGLSHQFPKRGCYWASDLHQSVLLDRGILNRAGLAIVYEILLQHGNEQRRLL